MTVEAYAANKKLYFLRPVPFSHEDLYPLYENIKYIKTYKKFEAVITDEKIPYEFPVPKVDLNKYYDIDNTTPSYIRICDYLEETLNDSTYSNPRIAPTEWAYWMASKNIILNRAGFFRRLFKLSKKNNPSSPDLSSPKMISYYEEKLKKNFASNHEIKKILKRIKKCIG